MFWLVVGILVGIPTLATIAALRRIADLEHAIRFLNYRGQHRADREPFARVLGRLE